MTALARLLAVVFVVSMLLPVVHLALSSSGQTTRFPLAGQRSGGIPSFQQAVPAAGELVPTTSPPASQPTVEAQTVQEAAPHPLGQALPAAPTLPGVTAWAELGPKPIANPNSTAVYGTAPFSGRITAIAINGSNPSIVYIGGAQGGVWGSTDEGATWTPLTDSQASLAIGTIAISSDGKTIYAGTGEPNHSGDSYSGQGLLKSTDGGRTWATLGAAYFTKSAISGVVLFPGNPGRLVVSTTWGVCCKGALSVESPSGVGIYLSTDGGVTWAQALSSADGISNMASDPSSSSNLYAGDFAGAAWRSTDGGSTWSKFLSYSAASLQGRVVVATSAASSGSVYQAFSDSSYNLIGVFRYDTSTSKENSLGLPSPPPPQTDPCGSQCNYDFGVYVDPTNSAVIYLETKDLFRSTNGGTTWTDLGGYASGDIHPDQHALAFSPASSSTIFVGNDGGLWKSTNRGTTWTNLNSGLGLTQFESIVGSPGSLMFGGTQDNGCVRYTGTSSWSQIQGGDGGWTGYEPTNTKIMYCNYVHLKFQKSTDGGITWNFATNGLNQSDSSKFYAPVVQNPNAPGTLYIGSVRVYKTTDFAQSWRDLSGVLGTPEITSLAVAPSDGNTLYLGDTAGDVKVSFNGGVSWQLVGTVQASSVNGIAVDPSNSLVVYIVFAGVLTPYMFTMQGATWLSAQLSSLASSPDVIRVSPNKALYVGTDTGVSYSTDGGNTWASPGTGLPNVAVFDLALPSASQVIAATHGRGAWAVTPTTTVTLTLSYSVKGGGSGYVAPVLTYTRGGTQLTAAVSTAPRTYTLDSGSTWSVSNPLGGSSTAERWQTNQVSSGAISTSQTISFVFYHQYAQGIGYSIAGGGSPGVPNLSSAQFGSASSAPLTPSQGTYWLDSGSPYSFDNPLSPSTSTERWYTPAASSGLVSAPSTLNIVYYHQVLDTFQYTVSGGGTGFGNPSVSFTQFGGAATDTATRSSPPADWVDAGTSVAYANPLTGSGSTERWETSTTAVTASSPAAIDPVFYHQYLLQVAGPSPSSSWRNAGSQASVSFPAVYGRSEGTGWRVVSYTIDGGVPQPVATTSESANATLTMDAPHTVSFSGVPQVQVSIDGSCASESLTSPTISGDTGWYDSGTSVTLSCAGAYGRLAGTGERLASYALNGGAATAVATTGTVPILNGVIDRPVSVSIISVTQYQLSVVGGDGVAISWPSPTGDGYYDSGTPLTVSSQYTWPTGEQGAREALASVSLDGSNTSIALGTGTFTSPTITMDQKHTLSFNSVVQYLQTFSFTDGAGSTMIIPDSYILTVDGKALHEQGTGVYLDSGASFTVSSVVWEGEDVAPTANETRSVTAPSSVTVATRVYDATVKVTDSFGFLVNGAKVVLTLANGTAVSGTTGGDGTFTASHIPIGTYTAAVQSFGFTSQIRGDASKQAVTRASVLLGTTSLGIVMALVLVFLGAAVLVLWRRRSAKPRRS